MMETSEESLSSDMKSLFIGGITTRMACGRMTSRIACQRVMPSASAASHWVRGIAKSPVL